MAEMGKSKLKAMVATISALLAAMAAGLAIWEATSSDDKRKG